MRERRLGSLLRHEAWSYTELFGVTLYLAWWSAMFRAIWVFHTVAFSGALDVGWLSSAGGQPPILALFGCVLTACALLTAAPLFDPRNRTGAGYALVACNAAFILVLGIALLLHGVFAAEYAQHRPSGARSEWNLAAELSGRWEVVTREEPDAAPRFPVEAFTLRFNGTSAVFQPLGQNPEAREIWGELEATESFQPKTRLFEHLERLLFGGSERFVFSLYPATTPFGEYERPALIVEAILTPRIEDLPSTGWSVWAAELNARDPRALRFRLVAADRRPLPRTRIDLVRVDRPATGWDLADELSDLRRSHWW